MLATVQPDAGSCKQHASRIAFSTGEPLAPHARELWNIDITVRSDKPLRFRRNKAPSALVAVAKLLS